ncbi:MAG: hypothetical protein WCI04_02500 [archaeon]
MYSPDGFASLACLLQNQCQFLIYQEPFIKLMQLFHGNIYAFFAMQAITWFALIIGIYLLSKELDAKHLFLTPFILIFAGTLFIDNYVGSFENDYIAIVIFIFAAIIWLRSTKLINKITAAGLVLIGTSFWMWIGYIKTPIFWSDIVEMNWWAQIFAWNLLTPVYLLGIVIAIWAIWKQKDEQHFAKLMLISFAFPKLWFFAIPIIIKTIDTGLKQYDYKPNFNFWMTVIIYGLLIGNFIRVGALTYEAWSYDTSQTNCFTVNHEYLARVEGKSLNYNQASIDEYNACVKKEKLLDGNK